MAILVKLGANINSKDIAGSTPLHYACSLKNIEKIRLLVELNADLMVRDFYGNYPMDYCQDIVFC
jgi:ankyrin repeat protein